jgi:hypothetical protein
MVSIFIRRAAGLSPSYSEAITIKLFRDSLGSIPSDPILSMILPFTSFANGGLRIEEKTTKSPKFPWLYKFGRLISSKGSYAVVVLVR